MSVGSVMTHVVKALDAFGMSNSGESVSCLQSPFPLYQVGRGVWIYYYLYEGKWNIISLFINSLKLLLYL